MSSSSTMPPPSAFAHRRTRLNHLPPSPPPSPETSPCGLRKMSLSKATTFHVPSSPPSDDDPVLSILHLPRRSSTASKTLLALMLGKEEEVTDSIALFEKQFSCNHQHWSDKSPRDGSSRRRAGRRSQVDIDGLKSVKESHEHLSDSGLGTSISSADSEARSITQEIESTANRLVLMGVASNESPSEVDHASSDSNLEFTGKASAIPKNNKRSAHLIHSSSPGLPVGPSAITRSISPATSSLRSRSSLTSFGRRKVEELVFEPILQEQEFAFYHGLAHSLEEQVNRKTIKCLRDLEKSLIFEPLRLSRSPNTFRRFAEFSIQLVLDTYPHLSETEQRRTSDRPYDNGYFLDLVQQVGRLAAQIGAHRESGVSDEMVPSADDRVTLEGGLSETGDVAELVRWDKEGNGISLRTGEIYEPTAGIKRSASVLDEDVERSMARRKKGALPLELRCSDKSCGKIFTRKCDLAKHEKTHSRPFKCPESTCKYHDMGLPTEKERDRHVNDKHSANPHFYHCLFCPFKTKRDSNCKQHMEKKHAWTYDRVKGGRKSDGTGETPQPTPQATPQTPSVSTPISVDYSSVHSISAAGSTFPTPVEQSDTFTEYRYEPATPVHLGGSLFGSATRVGSISGGNPYVTPPTQGMTVETPYSAISTITEQHINDLDMYGNGDVNFSMPNYGSNVTIPSPYSPNYDTLKYGVNAFTQMPMTPASSLGHHDEGSRQPSVSYTNAMSPANAGLAQTISPQLSMEEELMEFSAPSATNHSAFLPTSGFAQADLPTTDFSLFGSDGFISYAGGESADPFDTFINLQDDGYDA